MRPVWSGTFWSRRAPIQGMVTVGMRRVKPLARSSAVSIRISDEGFDSSAWTLPAGGRLATIQM